MDKKDLQKDKKDLQKELQDFKRKYSAKVSSLEKDLKGFEVYNLFPATREKKKRKVSTEAQRVRDHVKVLIDVKDDQMKDMVRELKILQLELSDARSTVEKDEAARAFLENLRERQVSYRKEALDANREKKELSKILKAMKNENLELERRLAKGSANTCRQEQKACGKA